MTVVLGAIGASEGWSSLMGGDGEVAGACGLFADA